VHGPAAVEAILDEFDDYLALERGRSDHTRRAYLGDLRSLFAFLAERAPDAGLSALSLPMLRSWLAAQAAAGAARYPAAAAQGPPHPAVGAAPGPGARRDGGRRFRCPTG
jgi:site-specific recombinase XerC